MKRTASRSLIACLAAGSTLFAGCYGSFALTKKVYDWNGEASSNKFVQWLVFVGLNVIPVYSLAVAVDAIVVNTVEFWTGDNPVEGVATRVEKNSDGSATVYRGDEVFTAVPVGADRVEIRNQEGQRIGMAATTPEGGLIVTDETGAVRYEQSKL